MLDGGQIGGSEVAAGAGVVVLVGAGAAGASQTDHTAPLLAFFGALLVALIAAVTAGRRQARALDAERTRLKDQLAHERKLHDLEHLRVLLDEAASAYEEARHACEEGAVTLRRAEADLTLLAAAIEKLFALSIMRRRLALRFPEDHPVYIAYNSVHDATNDRVNHLMAIRGRIRNAPPTESGDAAVITKDEDDHDTEIGATALEAFETFAEATRREVGPPA